MMNYLGIFAEEFTAPVGAATWLSCAFWVIGGVLMVLKIIDHFRKPEIQKLPQPLQVQYAQRLATHDELAQLRREFESSQDVMTKQIQKLGEDNETRTRRLHERIEEIPQKILNLLTSTKGLHK